MNEYELRQFDIVKIKTTTNVKYLAGPPGGMPTPHGTWNVIRIDGPNKIVELSKPGGFLCRVPILDVYIVGHSLVDVLKEQIQNGRQKTTHKYCIHRTC